jgi:hypothetical protein
MSVEVFREQLEGTPIPGSLLDAGVPLAPEQKTWLALQMYRAFGAELTAGASAQSSAGEVSREAFKTAVLTQASSQLTPAQIEALRNFFQKDDELTVLVKTMIRERASNPSGK